MSVKLLPLLSFYPLLRALSQRRAKCSLARRFWSKPVASPATMGFNITENVMVLVSGYLHVPFVVLIFALCNSSSRNSWCQWKIFLRSNKRRRWQRYPSALKPFGEAWHGSCLRHGKLEEYEMGSQQRTNSPSQLQRRRWRKRWTR